jgi:hypothetical protein
MGLGNSQSFLIRQIMILRAKLVTFFDLSDNSFERLLFVSRKYSNEMIDRKNYSTDLIVSVTATKFDVFVFSFYPSRDKFFELVEVLIRNPLKYTIGILP